MNIGKPPKFIGVWPKCSFFAIYDGHGGSLCAEFLRDNLHNYVKDINIIFKVLYDQNFPKDIKEAIRLGFQKADSDFLNYYALNQQGEVTDKSGSCAIVALIVGKIKI